MVLQRSMAKLKCGFIFRVRASNSYKQDNTACGWRDCASGPCNGVVNTTDEILFHMDLIYTTLQRGLSCYFARCSSEVLRLIDSKCWGDLLTVGLRIYIFRYFNAQTCRERVLIHYSASTLRTFFIHCALYQLYTCSNTASRLRIILIDCALRIHFIHVVIQLQNLE